MGRELYLLTVFGIIAVISKYIHHTNQDDKLDLDTASSVKGICAILILIGHCVSAVQSNLTFLNVGWYCVGFFFFWSGYGVTNGFLEKPDYLSLFWKVRLVKLFTPFLVANVMYIGVRSIFGIKTTFLQLLLSFLGQCTIVDNSWYPIAIILFYFAFYVVFKKQTDVNHIRRVLLFRLICTFLIISISEIILFSASEDWWFISNGAFIVGVMMRFNLMKMRGNVFIAPFMFFVGLLMMPVCNRFCGYSVFVYALSCNLMCASLIWFVIEIIKKTGFYFAWLKMLGDISYEIYLYHGLFIFLIQRMGGDSTLMMILSTLVGTILCSTIMHKIDDWLVHKIMKGIC